MMKVKSKDGGLYLENGKLEIYTPQNYLGSSTRIDGHRTTAFGLVPYKYYDKVTDKKPSKVGILNNPSMTVFYPIDIIQNVRDTIWEGIYDDTNENEYLKLTFEGGGRILDANGIQSLDNVVMFMEYLLGGKLDNNIPYPYIAPAFIQNMMMNKKSLNIPATNVNMIPYELCRSKHNKSVRFATIIGKDPKVSPVAYTFANIREICASNSVFSALAFEDMNSMLDSSLNMTVQGKEQLISPIEQVIHM